MTMLTPSSAWQTFRANHFYVRSTKMARAVLWPLTAHIEPNSATANHQLDQMRTYIVRPRPQAMVILQQVICNPAMKRGLGPMARPRSLRFYATRLASTAQRAVTTCLGRTYASRLYGCTCVCKEDGRVKRLPHFPHLGFLCDLFESFGS